MQAIVIRRHYDEVIASHYDFDPQSVLADSFDRAMDQIRRQRSESDKGPLAVLDLGVGTGLFLDKLRADIGWEIQPFGLDLSPKMIDIARTRIPDLVPAIDDAANLDNHFQSMSFDLICTHFITGFVPVTVLAPKIANKLERGGLWSFVGGARTGFPHLRRKAESLPFKKWLFGSSSLHFEDLVCNPIDQDEVVRTLKESGFTVCEAETFCPNLHFTNLKDFMEFAYYGGWLTPFVESMGLHRAGLLIRWFLNAFYFPTHDQHKIVLALARKD